MSAPSMMPANFAELARTMSNPELMATLGVSKNTICEWRRAVGVPAQVVKPRARWLSPVPADFAERAAGKTIAEVRNIYRAGYDVVRRWFTEAGMEPGKRRSTMVPLPADFAGHARVETDELLCKRYDVSQPVVTRWRKETGIHREVGRITRRRDLPVDWYDVAPTMTQTQLCAHYGAGGAVKRWIRETGVVTKKYEYADRKSKISVVSSMGMRRSSAATLDRVNRDMSLVGRAAEHIRPLASLVRCDKNGKINRDGKFWLRGGSYIKTDDEILELAYRKGFNPDAWRELGAAA